MRTALLRAPRKLDLVVREKPRPGPGEVLVRTAATAVCHTDLSIYTGAHPGVRYPVVMGTSRPARSMLWGRAWACVPAAT